MNVAVLDIEPVEPPALPGSGESFVPSPGNQRQYRDALGHFATGVTIVTAMTERGPVGMTVNSFASVSLDPPLVLWSLARDSGRFPVFGHAERCAIHVLREDQRGLALLFARQADAFSHCQWSRGDHDLPLIEGTLARFECCVSARHDAGDHVIQIGAVERVTALPGWPLVFAGGEFGSFVATGT